MKHISVREFQLHASKYLKMLPLVLTKYNLPVAKLTSFDKFIDRSVDKNIDTPIVPKPPVEKEEKTPIKKILQKKLPKTNSNPGLCKHGYQKGLCKFGCK